MTSARTAVYLIQNFTKMQPNFCRAMIEDYGQKVFTRYLLPVSRQATKKRLASFPLFRRQLTRARSGQSSSAYRLKRDLCGTARFHAASQSCAGALSFCESDRLQNVISSYSSPSKLIHLIEIRVHVELISARYYSELQLITPRLVDAGCNSMQYSTK